MNLALRRSLSICTGLAVLSVASPGGQLFAQASQSDKATADLAFWEELAFWETIKDSQDVAEYEAYLATYPDGRFARLAEIRIRALKASQDTEAEPQVPTGAEAARTTSEADEPDESSGPGVGPGGVAGGETAAVSERKAVPFTDCPVCPQMIVVPPGAHSIGSEQGRANEMPRHRVDFRAPFALGIYEVTIGEWMACVRDGGCDYEPSGADDERLPASNLSWDDAAQYTAWLTEKTGFDYRLPSEAEWEYAASGGMDTAFWWGDEAGEGRANCKGCGGEWDGRSVAPVGSFEANPFGLHDIHGNLWEWTLDCANPSYDGAPSDGSPRLSGDCLGRMLRGGSWNLGPEYMRTSRRNQYDRDVRYYVHGFRVLKPSP